MNATPRTLPFVLSLIIVVLSAHAVEAASAQKPRTKAGVEEATRLQVFLDRADFAPGKIDGRYGEFTVQALALYRESKGETPLAAESEAGEESDPNNKADHASTPDVTGLDLASIEPVFKNYTVTKADLQAVGAVAESVPAQARQKSLPYKSVAETVAEKFHTDVDFLGELNPGKTKTIKAGDVLLVPNVEPFDLPAVTDLKAGSEIGVNEVDEELDKKSERSERKESEGGASAMAVKVNTKTNMLTVFDGDKLIAAYPVTIGSAQTASPVGDWTVRGIAKMPNFRYDKAMLKRGKRSGEFHLLPPGPNNPVGVIWIQLSKKGIGLHGTSDPDAIGRNASHGCVRLANWDVVRLATKVKPGVAVSIQ